MLSHKLNFNETDPQDLFTTIPYINWKMVLCELYIISLHYTSNVSYWFRLHDNLKHYVKDRETKHLRFGRRAYVLSEEYFTFSCSNWWRSIRRVRKLRMIYLNYKTQNIPSIKYPIQWKQPSILESSLLWSYKSYGQSVVTLIIDVTSLISLNWLFIFWVAVIQ